MGLEGARDYTLAGRLSLRPSVEVGLRHDGGDAESGAGLVVGSGRVLADASTGLAVDLRVRMLVLHQAEGFRERDLCLLVVTALYGISCSFRGTAGAGAVPVRAQPVVPPVCGGPDTDPQRPHEAAAHRQLVAPVRLTPGPVGDAGV